MGPLCGGAEEAEGLRYGSGKEQAKSTAIDEEKNGESKDVGGNKLPPEDPEDSIVDSWSQKDGREG